MLSPQKPSHITYALFVNMDFTSRIFFELYAGNAIFFMTATTPAAPAAASAVTAAASPTAVATSAAAAGPGIPDTAKDTAEKTARITAAAAAEMADNERLSMTMHPKTKRR